MTESPGNRPTDDQEAALEAQQLLLETSLALVFSAYDDGVTRKMRDPVVILLDCEDEIGGEIARSWLGEETVTDAINDRAASDDAASYGESETTVFAHAFPLARCRREVPAVFPYLSPALEKPPTDGFLAVSVTSSGASVLTVPFDARP